MISGVRINILIGDRQVLRCCDLWIESVRHQPLTRASITLPDGSAELYQSIASGESVQIRLGLRDESPAVWSGTVAGTGSYESGLLTVRVTGPETPLIGTRISQHWESESAEAIVRWAIKQAGLTEGRIDAPGVSLPHFVASDVPVWQVAAQAASSCQRSFDLDMSGWALWMGADGVVNWGDFEESGDGPVIASGDNLITHVAGDCHRQLNMVTTFLTAGLRHSRLFHLADTRRGIDGQYRALRVRHHVQPERARTIILYGEEYGQC